MINPFEIYIINISWGIDGKNRPVLVILLSDENVFIHPITTQYENKSETVRRHYFKMNDWSQAGLAKQSYIDTGTLIKLPLSVIDKRQPIGRLTFSEKQRLLEFFNYNKK